MLGPCLVNLVVLFAFELGKLPDRPTLPLAAPLGLVVAPLLGARERLSVLSTGVCPEEPVAKGNPPQSAKEQATAHPPEQWGATCFAIFSWPVGTRLLCRWRLGC